MIRVVSFLPEVFVALHDQLKSDEKRWGDTWLKRNMRDQDGRFMIRINRYFTEHMRTGAPIPYLKIMGECVICLIRLSHPELFPE